MSKALIIAEKPSVAADIARALGGFTKQQDFFESDQYVLSSAVGHLLELHEPEEYEVKRGKWTFGHLPVIPPHFALRPIERSEARLKLLTKLIKRKDVGALINACDAGREGELIFRYIVQHAAAKQSIRRLWLQSMTPAAIRDAFGALRSDAEMLPLADAARCRSEADWLVGINGTRAMTAFNSKGGGFFLTTVGRVQTPTLTIVVDREDKIRKFVARDYWEVRASFDCQAGSYDGRWFDRDFRKRTDAADGREPAAADGRDPDARAERLWQADQAAAIVAECRGQSGTVSEESKPSTQLSPLLFDLTSLQREGNSRFGFSAKATLGLAQALYEKHKVLTYPRTDSRFLPEDYIEVAGATVEALAAIPSYAPFARMIRKRGWIKPNRRVFDNTKVSDHFAIIPTLETPKHLSEPEQKIYDLVARRFLAVFFPAAEYLVTTRITTVATHPFKTEGKVLVEAGWLAIYGRDGKVEPKSSEAANGAAPRSGDAEPKDAPGAVAPSDKTLVAVAAGETVACSAVDAHALQTRPPPRYNEGTLLSAMEGAGKLVDDEDLRAAMEGKGLGTPATRAAIIEGLISERYLVRDGKDLHPTAKAFQLLTLLRGLGVEELTAPELTGGWEQQLAQIERGRLARDAFMREIAQMTQKIVERAKSYESDTVPGDYATLKTPCPKCGAVVQENYRRYACTACDFSLPKHPASRTFEYDEVEQLLAEGKIGPLTGFRSKIGRPFVAVLKLSPDYKLEFDFGNTPAGEDGSAEAIDFSSLTPVGVCPKCGAGVYEQPMSYLCEKSVGLRTCDFRSGKVILQQPIELEQMRKLLAEGRTDVLRGFVSNRTRRKFSAFLVKKPDGAIGFEFEPRAIRGAAKAAPDGALAHEAGATSVAAAVPPIKPAPGAAKKATVTALPVKKRAASVTSASAARAKSATAAKKKVVRRG